MKEEKRCAMEKIKYYKTYDGICVIAGSVLGSGFEPYGLNGITIPDEIDGVPVTELRATYLQQEIGYIEAFHLKRISLQIIGDGFREMRCGTPLLCGGVQNSLESMELEFSASKMHLNSFDCTQLTKVIFKGKVVDDPDWDYGSFADRIFLGCEKLVSISGIFEGWYLGSSCFAGCTALRTLPVLKIKVMGDEIFKNCKSLSKIHLSNGLKRIGSNVFENCISLEDLYIPDTVEEIGNRIFSGCISLQSVHMPKKIFKISNGMFQNCVKLKKVFLPDELKQIENDAFYGCRELQSPWMLDGLLSIGERAFYGCSMIKEIWIPQSVTFIGEDAFSECPGVVLKGKIGSAAEKYANENGISFIGE